MSVPLPQTVEDIEIQLLLEAVFLRYHYDFRYYARASVKRRLRQARTHFGAPTFTALQERLLHDPDMMGQMLGFLTVQVSEMFRDPEYFRALREQVLPHLTTYPSLKVWIAGCSTGEEVYSMAILFKEEGLLDRTLFYATDINPEALAAAKAGIYSLDRIRKFTENHQKSGARSSLSEYYIADYGRAVFDSKLRSNIVFSDHSLVSDAVFGEMQLISCRNVMIYFDRALQDRAIGLFKDSLSRGGFLGIGSKETLRFSKHVNAFTDFVPAEKIYRKKDR